MTAATQVLDFRLVQRRTRWTMTTSFVVHVLLLLWITTIKSTLSDLPVITEITLLEPGDLAPAAPSASAPAPAAPEAQTVQGMASKSSEAVHFRRMERDADIALDPQADWALKDRLDSRLAALQKTDQPSVANTATAGSPTSLFGTAPATVVGPGGTGAAPVKLNRGGGSGGTGIELSRGLTPGAPASLAPAGVSGKGAAAAAAPAKAGQSTASRTIAGASLAGPIADRPVLFYTLPVYPEWAKEEAVEGSVTLYFVVLPDGSVKENVLVQKTAGFGDFDENARAALRAWRFEALKGGRTGEQWGTITFHYRLRDAR